MEPPYAIQLGYGVLGILSYLLLLCVIVTLRKTITRSFIFLFTLTAVTNIGTWVNLWMLAKFASEPFFFPYFYWLLSQPLLVDIQIFLMTYFYYAQNAHLLLLTIDRFIGIYSVLNNTKWWYKYYWVVTISVHILCLAIHSATRLPITSAMYFDNGSQQYLIAQNDDKKRSALVANVQLGFGISVFFACLILNVVSFKHLRGFESNTSNPSSQHSRARERNLFIIGIFMFLTQALNVAVVCSLAVFHLFQVNVVFLFGFMTYSSDLFSFGPAMYTILLPGPVRRFLVHKITSLLRCGGSSS